MLHAALALLGAAAAILLLSPATTSANLLANLGLLTGLAVRLLDLLGPDAAGTVLAVLRAPTWAHLGGAGLGLAILALARRPQDRVSFRARPGRLGQSHLPPDAGGPRPSSGS